MMMMGSPGGNAQARRVRGAGRILCLAIAAWPVVVDQASGTRLASPGELIPGNVGQGTRPEGPQVVNQEERRGPRVRRARNIFTPRDPGSLPPLLQDEAEEHRKAQEKCDALVYQLTSATDLTFDKVNGRNVTTTTVRKTGRSPGSSDKEESAFPPPVGHAGYNAAFDMSRRRFFFSKSICEEAAFDTSKDERRIRACGNLCAMSRQYAAYKRSSCGGFSSVGPEKKRTDGFFGGLSHLEGAEASTSDVRKLNNKQQDGLALACAASYLRKVDAVSGVLPHGWSRRVTRPLGKKNEKEWHFSLGERNAWPYTTVYDGVFDDEPRQGAPLPQSMMLGEEGAPGAPYGRDFAMSRWQMDIEARRGPLSQQYYPPEQRYPSVFLKTGKIRFFDEKGAAFSSQWKGVTSFEGSFDEKNLLHGPWGRVTYTDGRVDEGEFVHGWLHGEQGSQIFLEKSAYDPSAPNNRTNDPRPHFITESKSKQKREVLNRLMAIKWAPTAGSGRETSPLKKIWKKEIRN